MLRRPATILVPLALLLSSCVASHPITPQLASASTDFARAQPVKVQLASFKFVPSTIHLKAGKPYALELTNVAHIGHNFSSPAFFAAARIDPVDGRLVKEGKVELAPGKSAKVYLVPAKGAYKLDCTHFGHAALGMRGTIIVS